MACLQLLEQRSHVRFQEDIEYYQHALPSLVKVYAKKVLSQQSDLTGSEQALEAS